MVLGGWVDWSNDRGEYYEGLVDYRTGMDVGSVPMDKATEMADANQFFDFILERFAFVCSVAIIFIVLAVLGHVGIGGVRCFTRWRDEIGMKGFV